MRYYDIFLSHSWRYSKQYEAIKNLLANRLYFKFRDYSIPEEKRIGGPSSWVWSQIGEQIRQSSVFLFPAGVYATHSPSIRQEIRIAKELGKPIIAVQPWGADRTSSLTDEADRIVGWNAESIVQAIRELC